MSRDSFPLEAASSHVDDAAALPPKKLLSEASTVEEVQTTLKELRAQHNAVTTRLDASLSQHDDLLRHLRRLDLSRARLGTLATSTRAISHGMLSSASSTASRISTAVSRLDLEQARLSQTLAIIEQTTDLKACVLGVVGSMGAPQDWETAAEYLARASRIPDEVIDSGFAEAVVPTAEVPEAPRVTLETSAESLCRLFLKEFERAVEAGDGVGITRFFKMFPLVQRAREGLEAYAKYVCQGVALRARARLQAARGVVGEAEGRKGFVYANALTKLFEHIAQVVDGHSPLVERHYGDGTMEKVIERLHGEADVQGGIVLDTWYDERGIERKLTDVKSYAFSFLVQSFMGQKNAPSRPQSTVGGASANLASEDDTVDTKEIDQVLGEVVVMLNSWSLYVSFISSRTIPLEESNASDTSPPQEQALKAPTFLTTSALPKKVTKTLIDPFKTFSTFFLRRSVERAFQLDESPLGLSLHPNTTITANPPFITSAVDDIMYVVSQLLQRAMSTSQAEIVVSTSATIARVLGSDFIGMAQRKMRDESYPKPVVQGALPPEDKVLQFMVLINNLDVACDYMGRIVRTHLQVEPSQQSQQNGNGAPKPRTLANLFPMGRDAHAVKTALESLESSVTSKARELLGDGIAVLFAQVLKPRLRQLLADVFREVDYSADYSRSGESGDRDANGDEYADDDVPAGETKAIRNRLQHGWEVLTRPLKRILTAPAYDRLLSAAVTFIAGVLERRIWSYHGKVGTLGAVALERDISDLVNIVTRNERFALREGFARCVEIVSVMNLEEEEWDEQMQLSEEEKKEMGWVLSEEERARARGLMGKSG